jgi:hypothetical protein
LLRQFKKEAIATGSFIIDLDRNKEHEESGHFAHQAGSSNEELSGDLDLSLVIQGC